VHNGVDVSGQKIHGACKDGRRDQEDDRQLPADEEYPFPRLHPSQNRKADLLPLLDGH